MKVQIVQLDILLNYLVLASSKGIFLMVLTKYGWEKDIIFMPQDMTEDVLTMIFKITYFTLANPTNQ